MTGWECICIRGPAYIYEERGGNSHETEVWHQGSRFAIGIGTALFVVLTNVQVPFMIIPNTALQSRVAVLTFFSAVFGPIVGGAIGIIGHALGDALFYGSVWWSWVFPDGLFGIIVGLFAAKYAIKEGGFTGKSIVLFNVVQVIANALAWIVLAPVLDILIYAEPANKVIYPGCSGLCGKYCGCRRFWDLCWRMRIPRLEQNPPAFPRRTDP